MIHNVGHLYLKHEHHLDELPVVLEKLICEVRALVLLREYLQLHQYFANEFDLRIQMLQEVRKFAVMRRTEWVSRARDVIAFSKGIVIILILLTWSITM